MIALADAPSVLLVDPLNSDRGHPVDDDLFLSQCIAPLTRKFLVVTSPGSAANIQRHFPVPTSTINPFDDKARFPRKRLLKNVLNLPANRFHHVVFQSFEEVSTLAFMLRHPRTHVHLIVTSNLRPDRFTRRPILGRLLIRTVFRRAASIIVHCQHEVRRILDLVPGISHQKIFIKPFHQMGHQRECLELARKAKTILFLGPECSHKRLDPVLDLIRADRKEYYQYVLCGMREMSESARAFLQAQRNVKLLFGHTGNDDYYRHFSDAALVILTHDLGYEGALSGAFCDAIASGTAVIARDMAPHNEFFEQFGPMGFLVDFNNLSWCQRILNTNLEACYEDFQKNMARLRQSCSLEANRAVFTNVLNCIS